MIEPKKKKNKARGTNRNVNAQNAGISAVPTSQNNNAAGFSNTNSNLVSEYEPEPLTDTEIHPLIREVQSLKMARISWRVTCTLCINVCLVLLALASIVISVFLLSFILVFPYKNYFVTQYDVDSGYQIESNTAVSSVNGAIRQGLGFKWLYERMMFPYGPNSLKDLQVISFPNHYMLIYSVDGSPNIHASAKMGDYMTVTNQSSLSFHRELNIISATAMSMSESEESLKSNIAIHRFSVLFSIPSKNDVTYEVFILSGQVDYENFTISFDSVPTFLFEAPLLLQNSGPILSYSKQAFMTSLPNTLVAITAQRSDWKACVIYLYQYNVTQATEINNQYELSNITDNQIWKKLDAKNLTDDYCRTGGISVLSGYETIIATENELRLVDFDHQKITTYDRKSGGVRPFSCRPSYTMRKSFSPYVNYVDSYVDIKVSSPKGFLVTCTWYNSGSALFGKIGNNKNLDIGNFITFSDNDVIPHTVRVSSSQEQMPSPNQIHRNGLFITYKSKSTGKYLTLRAATIENYQGYFVAYSKLFRHFSYEEQDQNTHNFTSSVSVTGTADSNGIIFASSRPPEFGYNAIIELELGDWRGGIKWVGISSINANSGESASIVQKGISSHHRGLVPGASYFADEDGKLTLSRTDTYVGIARSSTELMISDEFVV